MFSTASGIGESARLCHQALNDCGVETLPFDLSSAFHQQDLHTNLTGARSNLRNASTIVVHANPPEFERALFEMNLGWRQKKRIIGYWAWELPTFPKGWDTAKALVSEIWVPSDFVKTSLQQRIKTPKIISVPHYVPIPELRPPSGATDVCILVMADGKSSFARKNILGALKIFLTAFPNASGVKLIFKLRNLSTDTELAANLSRVCLEDSRISIVSDSLDLPQLNALIQSCDILLSAHRAEGFGLPLAQAMAMRKTVVATNWSGNLEFMNPKNSVLLPFDLVKLEDDSGIYSDNSNSTWAGPRIIESAQILRTIVSDSERREKIGQRAQKDIQLKLSSDNIYQALTG